MLEIVPARSSHAILEKTHVEMAPTVHGVPPLRRHNSDGAQVAFDLARGDFGGGESGLVDQQRFVLDRSVGCEAMRWDLVFEDLQVFEGG